MVCQKKRYGLKIVAVVECIIYLCFTIFVLFITFQKKYVCINIWEGLLLCGGVGILCPLLASISIPIFLKRQKRRLAKIVSFILIPYIGISCISLFCFLFGGIICSSTEKIAHYLVCDELVEPKLKTYRRVLPEKEEKGLHIEAYRYKYVESFNDSCDIYIKTKYEALQQLEEKLKFFEEKIGMTVENSTEGKGTYQYGQCTINYNIKEMQVEYIVRLRTPITAYGKGERQ